MTAGEVREGGRSGAPLTHGDTMAKLVANTFLTLDGVMQAPGGPEEDRSNGFAHGGWSVPYWNDDMLRVIAEESARMDALLLGRTTYDIFAAHWPRVSDEDPVAATLNRAPKYVASNTAQRLEWHNSTLVRGDALAREVERLKGVYGREIQIHGSWGLLQTLNAAGLVDEYRLWVFPVTLGSGKRLFGDGTAPAALRLLDARTFGTGVVVQRYERAGTPGYGSFALDR